MILHKTRQLATNGIVSLRRVVHVAAIVFTVAFDSHSVYASDPFLTIYTAKNIVTMDKTNPTATAVAVKDKRIVAVGSMADLKPWLEAYPYNIDDSFKDKVLMPGLIDPHLHPLLGAIQLRTHWIPPESWELHDEKIQAVTTPEGFHNRLLELLAKDSETSKLFIAWGWSELYHGSLSRADLDKIAPYRAVMVWQRSVHEAIFNSSALKMLNLTEDIVKSHPQHKQVNWDKGHFIEGGFFDIATPRLAPHIFSPDFIDKGFTRNSAYLLSRGITTVGDMAIGSVNWELELDALKRNFTDKAAPLRIVLVPDAYKMIAQKGSQDEAFDFIAQKLTDGKLPNQLIGGKRIKLFADGAMFSLLMSLNPPGYVGFGHNEWITPKDEFESLAKKYWQEGYKIYIHANGDAGIDFTMDVFEKLQVENPRLKNAISLEHYGYANERINQRIADFGASVSANPYYVTFLGDTYSKVGLGPDRARRITPIRGLVDRNVLVTLHSDFGMAPADPLRLAWAAITRESLSGKVMMPPGGLSLDEAMRAITINAAQNLGLEKDIGTIEAGKFADFAVLDTNPYDVGVEGLRDIKIWGVVFEGKTHEAVHTP